VNPFFRHGHSLKFRRLKNGLDEGVFAFPGTGEIGASRLGESPLGIVASGDEVLLRKQFSKESLWLFAGSSIGDAHLLENMPRQDHVGVALTSDSDFLVCALSDGVGFAPDSESGAQILVSVALETAIGFLEALEAMDFDADRLLEVINSEYVRRLSDIFTWRHGSSPQSEDDLHLRYAATLEMLVISLGETPEGGNVFRWIRLAGDGFCRLVSRSKFVAVDPDGLTAKSTNLTHALPLVRGSFPRPVDGWGTLLQREVLVAGTDGLIDQFLEPKQILPRIIAKGHKWHNDASVFRNLLRVRSRHLSDDRTLLVIGKR